MTHASPPAPSRRLHKILGLSLSAAALAGLVYLESAHAEPAPPDDVAAWDDDFEDEDVWAQGPTDIIAPAAAALVAPTTPAAVAPTLAAAVPNAPVVAAAIPTVALPPAAIMVVVPDVEGMDLREARRAFRDAGLRTVVRDEYGDRIERDMWSEYEVARQSLEPGTEVTAKTWVRIEAEYEFDIAEGY